MIQYRKGDIAKHLYYNNDIDVFFHQCNCFNTMGKGVAKSLSRMFPQILAADNTTKAGDINKLGTFTATYVYNNNNKSIWGVNLYGQYSYKYGTVYKGNKTWTISELRYPDGSLAPLTSIPHLRNSIELMLKDKNIGNLKNTFATVRIGCGLGGGNWEYQIEPMLKELFKDRILTVFDL